MHDPHYETIVKNTNKPIAFLLGSYLISGLGASRCLGRNDVPVLWLDANPKQIGFLSKYCTGVLCPHPKKEEKHYLEFLLELGEKQNTKGVLFPLGDIEALAVLKNKRKLENYYWVPSSDLSITELFLNKYLFYQTLKKYHIPHATTFFPQNLSEVKTISTKITYPCLVKPSFSGYFRLVFHIKFFIAHNKKQLIQWYITAQKEHQEVMIQEVIPGDDTHMYGVNAYVDKQQQYKGLFMYHRMRGWPNTFGNGCLIENTYLPELEQIIRKVVASTTYHGIVDAEFKQDFRDTTYKLVEINPRCWMQNTFPAQCGVNILYMAYRDAIGKNVESSTTSGEQARWLFMFDDNRAAVTSIRNGELSLKEWIRSFKHLRGYGIFAKDDILPFLTFLTYALFCLVPFSIKYPLH
jgi:predicted ATP-grasp superfamily ATP-dependent carboligase